MPEDLLLELESMSASDNLEQVENLLPIVLRELSRAIEGGRGAAAKFEAAWSHLVLEVAEGHTQEVHAARGRLLGAFEKELRLLKQMHRRAAPLRNMNGDGLPDPDVLLPEIAAMERLKANVLDRSQTADDLEDLAARDYPLTAADLERIGSNNPVSGVRVVFTVVRPRSSPTASGDGSRRSPPWPGLRRN